MITAELSQNKTIHDLPAGTGQVAELPPAPALGEDIDIEYPTNMTWENDSVITWENTANMEWQNTITINLTEHRLED